MHILQLGPYPPPEGGVSRNMLAIRDELERRGDKCSIVATTRSSRIDGVPGVFHPRTPFGVLRLLASLRSDVVHLHIGGDVGARVVSLAAAVVLFGRGRSILTLHSGRFPLTDAAKKARPGSIRGRVFNRFSKIIAVSESIADVFRRYGVPNERIELISPFSAELPDPAVAVPATIKAFYERHSPILLSVGGLEPDYDPLFQIAAMKSVLAEFPDAGLAVVGDGSMRSEVERAADGSGYKDRIFLAGNVAHAVVLHLIKDADVVLRTTLFDGDAISVREALFLGTPVIATDTGMRPDGVHLIPIGDDQALASQLITAIELGKTDIQPLSDTSNIDSVIKLYEEICRSL